MFKHLVYSVQKTYYTQYMLQKRETRRERLDLQPLLLRGGEVAEVLGCSRALAYRWMAAGIIPTIRVPGSKAIRVPREALLAWIANSTQHPRGGAAA